MGKMLRKLGFAALFTALLVAVLTVSASAVSGDGYIDLADTNPPAAGTGWSYSSGVYTVAGDVTITGEWSGGGVADKSVIYVSGSTVNITLDGATIDVSGTDNACAFEITNGSTVNLTLAGDNVLKSGIDKAGLQVETGNTLIIDAADTSQTLTVTGASGGEEVGGGAGIGGGNGGGGGTITINGGRIDATGGAAIGGGKKGDSGIITINGGIVYAMAIDIGSGIGAGGYEGQIDAITINGGIVTATGTGSDAGIGGNGGVITITGGTVTAIAGKNSAGIGGGDYKDSGIIIITGGTINATGNGLGAGIGGGRDGGMDNITITGGNITAIGGDSGAGIGGNSVLGGIITITGDNTVVSSAGGGTGPDIGYANSGGTLVISDGATVTLESNGIAVAHYLLDGCTVDGNGAGGLSGEHPIIQAAELPSEIDISKGSISITQGTSPNTISVVFTDTTVKKADNLPPDSDIIITGTTSSNNIVVSDGVSANITLKSLKITRSTLKTAAFEVIGNAAVNLTLLGDNTLKSGNEKAGLQVQTGNTLVIAAESTGSLTATGGGSSAGIGGGNKGLGGSVTISGGTVTATGNSGAGIGGGYSGAGGSVTINGGTVIASGGSNGAGIGGGYYGVGGSVTISGGTVTATGGSSGAGIGGGYYKAGGIITISGGTVTAVGGNYGAGIGGGRSYNGNGTFDMVGNAVVFTTGGSNSTANVCTGGTRSGGILFDGDAGTVYGTTAPDSFTIPDSATLTIGSGKTLTVKAGVCVYNYGTITVDGGGTLNNNGTIYDYDGATTTDGGVTVSNQALPAALDISTDSVTILPGSAPNTLLVTHGANTYGDITNTLNITITGTTTGNTITVQGGVTTNITLQDATIDVSGTDNACAFEITGGSTVNLTLVGDNILKSGNEKAGLQVQAGNTLVITAASTGLLTATGGGSSAGIGGGPGGAGGTITISGGTVAAHGGGSGAGIGGGNGGAGGTIAISGGTVTANGGESCAGIGGSNSGAGGNITISGGTVMATGGDCGAGIGGGLSGAGGDITITGGTVTAIGGHSGAGIGGGLVNNNTGTLNMTGNAVVFATGGTGSSIKVCTSGSRTGGILFDGDAGIFYGTAVTPTDNFTIPIGATLTIGSGKTLTIDNGVTLTNDGTITVYGSLVNNGTIDGNGSITYMVTGVSLNKSTTTIKVSDTATLTATVAPANATDKTVSWGSDNTGVATVDSNGVVTAVAVGTATITVTTDGGGFDATCEVTVIDVPSAPTNLFATPGNQQIALSWTAPNNGGSAITRYEYSTNGASWYTVSGSSSSTVSATITGLTNGTAYTVQLRAVNAAGEGASDSTTATPKASPSLTLTVSPETSQTYPGDVTLTATLSGASPDNAGRTITFGSHGYAVTNSSGVATKIISLTEGSYSFSASFSDGANNEATDTINGYTVSKGAQAALSITGLNDSYTYGDASFTIGTNGGSGSGAVTFESGNTAVATVDESSGEVAILKAGTFTITATKAADSNYEEKSVESDTVTVSEATPTVTLNGDESVQTGANYTLTATVSGAGDTPDGTVTFKNGVTELATVALTGGTASHTVTTIAAGDYSFTATFNGETDYYTTAVSAAKNVSPGKNPQDALTITDPGTITYGDTPFDLSTSGGSGVGAVTYSVPTNDVLSVTSGGTVTIIGAGNVTITATKAGDNDYNQTTAMLQITVEQRDISVVSITNISAATYTGAQLQPTFDVTDTVASTAADYTISYGTNVDAGTGSGSITLNGCGNYKGTKTVNFDIDPRPLTGAAITLDGDTFVYNNAAHEPSITGVTVDGIAVPDTDYTVGYSGNTNAGTATVTVTATGTNFSGSESVNFTINQAQPTNVTPPTATGITSGQPLSASTLSGGSADQEGIFEWADPDAVPPAGTANYDVVFTPNDPNYAAVTIPVSLTVTQQYSPPPYIPPVEPTPEPTPEPEPEPTPTAPVTVDEDGKATVVLDEKTVADNKTEDGKLNLNVPEQTNIDAPLPLDAIGDADVEIKTDFAQLDVPNTALQNVKEQTGNDPTLHLEKTENGFKVSITAGDEVVNYNDKSNPITVAVPLEIEGNPNAYVAVLTTEDGEKIIVGGTVTEDGIVFETPTTGEFEVIYNLKEFDDATEHWASDDIIFAAARELFNGVSDTEFAPEQPMTRAMFATVLARVGGVDTSAGENWYDAGVKWAAENGIMSGNIERDITREELAVMLYRYLGEPSVDGEPKAFADGDKVSDWAKNAIDYLSSIGVFNGRANGNIDPKASITRAEVAAVLRRLMSAR